MIQKDVSLKNFNTFGIDVAAEYFAQFQSLEDLHELYGAKHWSRDRLTLGGGSNILFTGDFKGLVIQNGIRGISVVDETDDDITLALGAGENWHSVVIHCVQNGYGGIENLSLIPGTVGAAPIQNIGAYGVELKEVFESLDAFDCEKGTSLSFTKADCRFSYRDSIFKGEYAGRYIITYVLIRLTKRNHSFRTDYGPLADYFQNKAPSIKEISQAVIEIRKSKLPDPEEIGNAGSFFKNPEVDGIDFEGLRAEFSNIPGYKLDNGVVKIPAAWLIEQCGWKGQRRNGFGVHDRQALVLVNYGESRGSDIRDLAMEIKESVANRFGIVLAEEVTIL